VDYRNKSEDANSQILTSQNTCDFTKYPHS